MKALALVSLGLSLLLLGAAPPRAVSTSRIAALIKQLGTSAEVPAGRYSDVLVTNDRDLLDLNKDEDKYFALGVGLVKLGGLVNGHREEVWLVSILAPK